MLSIAVLSVFYVSFIIDNLKKSLKKKEKEKKHI